MNPFLHINSHEFVDYIKNNLLNIFDSDQEELFQSTSSEIVSIEMNNKYQLKKISIKAEKVTQKNIHELEKEIFISFNEVITQISSSSIDKITNLTLKYLDIDQGSKGE